MKTPLLFDLPPRDRPSDESILTAFCKEHHIWTHRSPREDEPWCAMAWKEVANQFHKTCDGSSSAVMDLVSRYCSWADDAGLLVTAKSRLAAVRKLCESLIVDCPL